MRWPRNQISPDVGARAPTRHEKSVVLPAPFGPMIPKTSPAATSNPTDDRASRPPNVFEIPRTESSASAGIGYSASRPKRGDAKCPCTPSNADQALRLEEHDQDQEAPVDEEKRVTQRGHGQKFDLERADDQSAQH